MKKVRITVSRGSQGKAYRIFNSPESLYVWLNDPELQEEPDLDPSLGNVVFLRQGEVMEVEWCGFENVYEDNRLQLRADYIRIGKLISSPTFFTGGKEVVGIQDGWITEDIVACRTSKDSDTRTTKLTPRSRHKFDLDELFSAREAYNELEDDEEDIMLRDAFGRKLQKSDLVN